MPDVDGFKVLEDIRKNNNDTPVIFLTARVAEADKLRGLGLGADDYICKPFSPREVVARVKAVLRRANAGQDQQLTAARAAKVVHRAVEQVTAGY